MTGNEGIIRAMKENMSEIKKHGVKKIGLFGSYTKNKQTEESDIDIVVEFEEGKATLDNFMGLASFLEELLDREVDLLTVEGVKSIRIDDVRKSIEESLEYVA